MTSATLTRGEIARLTARVERRVTQRLLDAVAKAKQGVHLTALERAILDRNYAAAVAAIGREPILNALAGAQEDTRALRDRGWEQLVEELPARVQRQLQVRLSLGAYATQRPEVLAAMQAADLRRIKSIDRETTTAIREQLTQALQEGTNPREAARQLRDTIGLNRRQAAAVAAYRKQLTAQGRDPAQIERMVARATARKAQDRAENIARTEIMTALNTGRQAQMQRLVNDGVLQAQEWEQEWVVADDERLCPECAPFDGQRTPIGGVFVSTEGTSASGPPLHPRCRCITRTVLRGFRQGASTPRQLRSA